VAVISAGPYANNLHLAPNITTPAPHHSVSGELDKEIYLKQVLINNHISIQNCV